MSALDMPPAAPAALILVQDEITGDFLVELEGRPALHGAADRRFSAKCAALEYANDLQELHGIPLVAI